jgi:23S rRNA pseudouridine2605 synthase
MTKAQDTETAQAAKGERIAKVMAQAGICSRRDAEAMIAEGKVKLDGHLVTTPATFILPGQSLKVNGKVVAYEKAEKRLWLYHKPAGLVTTHRDEAGRPTVFSQLPDNMPRVVSIGRLDLNSEGLLLLTTSGPLARHLELPATGWMRRYRVRLDGKPTARDIERLARGITVEGVKYGPIQLQLDDARDGGTEAKSGRNQWVVVSLQEGKNREIRRVMAALGYHVSRLIRLSYGPFQLGNLPRGELREVPGRKLRDQLGKVIDSL